MFKRLVSLTLVLGLLVSCVGMVSAAPAAEYFPTDEYIELETGLLRESVVLQESQYSSGGKYITINSNVQNSAENIVAEDFSYMFNTNIEADYRVFMRVYIPTSTSNLFFYRWNNGAWKTFEGTLTGDFSWVELEAERLKKGVNKLQFSHNSVGIWYDMLYVTSNGEFTPVEPEGVEKMPEIKASVEEFTQVQKRECFVPADSDGVMFEAENASFQTTVTQVSSSEGLSGGSALWCNHGIANRDLPAPDTEGWIEFVFTPEKAGKYNIWARTLCQGGGNDSWYVSVGPETDNAKYVYQAPIVNPDEYVWSQIRLSVPAEAGQRIKVRIRPRESGWRVDQFVVTDKPAYIPIGIEKEIVFKNNIMTPTGGVSPPVTPPAGEHPRLMFTKKDIPQLKANIEHPRNANVKEAFMSYAKGDVNLGTIANDAARTRIEAKALYYALYGDKEIGKEAVRLAQEAISWEMNVRSDGHERAYELILTMHSRVYDWCYDLMTPEERENVHNIGVAYCAQTETGWPPMQESLVGHGGESVLLRGMLSFAIATFDERPDYWDCVAGRFYKDYVAERAWHQEAEMHHQGSNYGYYRHQFSCWAGLLITRMGLEAPYDLKKAGRHVLSNFTYARRPDGSIFKWGDDSASPMMKYKETASLLDSMIIEHAVGKDPYVTDELLRNVTIANKDGIGYNTNEPVPWLLLYDPNVEPVSITNLPNSYHFGSPMGVTFARTGWEAGIDSNTATAVMFINEYMFGNHQHKDAGSFQLWYRGPLASDSGIYDRYGTENHKVWTYQTTAHNCLIVYDPDEPATNFANGVNDGGQIGVMGATNWDDIQNRSDKYHQTQVEGQEIDPENPVKPYYTYLKGNLENAYSDKISEYTRSFMFLDLKEENVPAALIVFDRVTTPNKNLEKRWLLHGQAEPVITGSRSVWGTIPYTDDLEREYTGKMVVDSLLPNDKLVETDVLGGKDEGWCIINGVNYYHTNDSDTNEDNTYRMEKRISGENTTYFLNCLQVTDESNENVYETKLIDADKFYGVEISDRVVMFSKSGTRVSDNFTITGQSGDKELRYTISDIAKGKWKVTVDGTEQIVYATEEGGVLAFVAKGKTVSAQKIDDSDKEEIITPEIKTENPITVRMSEKNGSYVGFKVSPRIENGKLMVPASGLKTALGLKSKKVFLGEEFTDEKIGTIASFKPGSNVYIKDGLAYNMSNNAYYDNGELMVELRTFAEAFNYKVEWNDLYQRAFLIPAKPTIIVNQKGYAKILSAKNDYEVEGEPNVASNAVDGVLTSVWATNGVGRYMQIELEKEEILENVEIIFNPNALRTPSFEIHLSTDGVNYEKVYEGKGYFGATGTEWEAFKFDVSKPNKAKYIRYVAKGSDKSTWNGVREIRFKTGTELVTWEEKDSYAKVIAAAKDEGPVDANCMPENLLDNNNRTVWAANGAGRYVDFTLENTEKVTGVDIVFNPNSKRTAEFEIMISNDGVNFEKVFEGSSNPNIADNTVEHYDFGTSHQAKYVRYVGNGSNISSWNGVKEIRIIKE